MVVVCVGLAGVTAAIPFRDCERGSLVGVVASTNDYSIGIRLLEVVCFARGRVQLEIVAVAERVHKRVAISIEIACLSPFFRKERPEDVTSCILDRQYRLRLILKLPKEGQVTVAILPCREEQLPLAEAVRPR